jgi:hypothetical protein
VAVVAAGIGGGLEAGGLGVGGLEVGALDDGRDGDTGEVIAPWRGMSAG